MKIFACRDEASFYLRMLCKYCSNFRRFNAHSANLHLVVKPAQKLQSAIWTVTATVSGPVNFIRWIITERILDESLQLFLWGVDVAEGSVRSADYDFSRLSNAAWLTIVVHNKGLRLGQRLTEMLYAIGGLVRDYVEALG